MDRHWFTNDCRSTFYEINRKIKALKRNRFGFRNIDNFFIRISLIHE
ncbi:transposase [Pediococcus parvulus]|nr:hypothetical protein [Pediococcus parvulus]